MTQNTILLMCGALNALPHAKSIAHTHTRARGMILGNDFTKEKEPKRKWDRYKSIDPFDFTVEAYSLLIVGAGIVNIGIPFFKTPIIWVLYFITSMLEAMAATSVTG